MALLIGVGSVTPVHAEPITILYAERAPYYVVQPDGTMGGLVNGQVQRALNDAGIENTWVAIPWNRQLLMIRQNDQAVCSPGWFKNPDREAFAKFSQPVYRDRPQVVVVRQSDVGGYTHGDLANLLSDNDRVVGVKSGFSYGNYVDGLIAETTSPIEETTQSIEGMVQMLLRGRFDYFLSAPEEYDVLADTMRDDPEMIDYLEMPDIPAGNNRYLICSQRVSDDAIDRFDAAIASQSGN